MTNKFINKTSLFMIALLSIVIGLKSCKKNQNTIVKITVINSNGTIFSNAMVRLWPEPTVQPPSLIVIDDTAFTNLEGVAIFNYSNDYNSGQEGLTVLNIEVNSGDTLIGEGIVKVEPEQTTEKTIVIQ